MSIEKKLSDFIDAREVYNEKLTALAEAVNKKCLFDAWISDFPDDGVCIVNEETMNVARISMFDLSKKLTEEEHEKYSI